MSPVFAHGRLRLYLLKLLEESPRHGYEVIRLLQDRFLGVYSPSPGTIYPRLARLEEEGLVSHEVVQGKKVYSLTDKGRAELNRRFDELAELEEELTSAAQQFAQDVKEDVRQTVRTMREELGNALRDKAAAKDSAKRSAPKESAPKSTRWGRPEEGLDALLRSFVADMTSAWSGAEPTESELRQVKSELDRALARTRRKNRHK